MKIAQLLSQKKTISFEFFPPKDESGKDSLFQVLRELVLYRPDYVSVTYGAMGNTRQLTVDLVRRIQEEVGLLAMAHLTCVASSKDEMREILAQLRAAGVENVLALRGDPPKDAPPSLRAPAFDYASALVEFIRDNGFNFCLGGACYPETHPQAISEAADVDHLKRKVDAGVDFLITQLFFDNSEYFRFLERVRRAHIEVPVVAGLMPITNVAQVKRFTEMCGVRVPTELLVRLEAAEEDRAQVRAIGVEHATSQAEGLLQGGAPGLHFYTLNRSIATREILDNLISSGAVAAPGSR
jgi:methylenetetrahydrofolate reductase (NADPH)